jgi:LacI family transcriptional regulator
MMNQSQKKQITLDDIARKLNISKVAVSKALRDHPDISDDTKKRVIRMADEMGYVPNFIARNLSSRRSNTIGLVVPKIAHHFFARAIESIYETAYDQNYEIITTVSQENAQHEIQHIQNLLSMRVDGLLVSITEQTTETRIFETVRDWGVPLVFFDRVIEGLGFSCVITNDFESAFQSITILLDSGYTTIGHLAGYQNTNIGRNRAAGFEEAFNQKGRNVPRGMIVEGGFGEEDGYRGLLTLIKNGSLPEVVFTVTYPVALGVMLAADEMNIAIPDQLEIISFGGSYYNRFLKPSLTFIDQPAQEMASIATQLLIEEIRSMEGSSGKTIEIPTRLIFCETCKKAKEIHNGQL